MHFHAEHSLFFERRQALRRPAFSLVLTLGILIVNTGAHSTQVSMIGLALGALLLAIAYLRGHRRLEPALTWTVTLIAAAILGGFAMAGDSTQLIQTVTRVGCGVIWILWLGTQLDWSSLRRILLVLRCPESIVSSLDHAVMNGVLTQREWARRRDAARLRLGTSRLPLRTWAQVLGEGALDGFLRLESMEENARLRSASISMKTEGDILDVKAVSIERGGRLILEQVDLKLNPGEWLLLCGPSGAGKSSLMRVLAGLDNPAKGSMSRFGTTVLPGTTLRDRLDSRVALLSQNPEHHFIASTVAEDIAWGLLRRGVNTTEAQERTAEMARALGVSHLLERPCHALSFGEQRRVALAGLLVLEPALLLLDEPTSGLDPIAAHELRILVGQLVQRTGAACIWATHDLHTLPPQAERVALLRDARLIFDGPMREGLSRPWMIRAGLAREGEGESLC